MIAIILATVALFLAAVFAHMWEDHLKYDKPVLSKVFMLVSSVGYAFTLLGLILIVLRILGVPT